MIAAATRCLVLIRQAYSITQRSLDDGSVWKRLVTAGASALLDCLQNRSRPFAAERELAAALLLASGIIHVSSSGPVYGGYWESAMPPSGSSNSIQCADGFACARAQQEAFYGTGITKKDCYLNYNTSGQLVSATCEGEQHVDCPPEPGNPGTGEIFVYPQAGIAPCNSWQAIAIPQNVPPYDPSVHGGYAIMQRYLPGSIWAYVLSQHGTKKSNASLICETGEYRTAEGCVTKPAPDKKPQCEAEVANPVDTRSGMKVERALDFTTGGNIPLKFQRHYSSNTGFLFGNFGPTRLGKGWRSSFDSSTFYEGSPSNGAWKVHIVLPEGTAFTFEYFGPNDYRQRYFDWNSKSFVTGAQTDAAKLVRDTGAERYELTTADDTLWSYDHSGRLRTIKYRGGYTQELAYDANGNNTAVQDSFGRQLSFTYTPQGLLSTMTVPGGQTYKYDYLGRYDAAIMSGVDVNVVGKMHWALQYVTMPDNTTDPADNPKIQYHYENATFPFALTGITDEKEVRWATWTYGTDGRVTSSEHASGVDRHTLSYDDTASTVTVTNPLTKQAIYHFTVDARGLHRLTQVEGVASAHCAAANTSYTYDAGGFLNQVTDGEGRVARIINDLTRGLPTSITRGYGTPDAVTTTTTWHSTLNVPTQVVEPGLTTDLTWTSGLLTQLTQTDTTSHTVPYSTNGQTRTWAYTYGTYGQLLTVDGPLSGTGDTVTYTYDSNGYVATITNEVGHVTTVNAVNGRGQPTSITDPNGVVTTLTYDSEGRLKTTTVDPTGLAAVTTIDYNVVGDVTKITRPNGAYLQYTYDTARRLTKIEDNTGASIELDRNNFGHITARRIKDPASALKLSQTATFDELGRLLAFVGASSQTWTHAYDKTDNLKSITDPRSNTYQWSFDSLNRRISETDEDSNVVTLTRNGSDAITNYSDPRSLNTSYVRNGFGDAIQRTSPDTGTTVYTFNALGKPTQITDGRGVVTNLTYDNAGRILTREYPADTSENIAYTWDQVAGGNKGKGRLTRIGDASGAVEWTYNALGQVTRETKATASVVYTVDYAYDLDGNVTQMTYPSGRIVTYSRDVIGRISEVTAKKDSGSSVVTLASGLSYLPFGPLQSLSYGNGLTLAKSFTGDYNPDTLAVNDAATPLVSGTYGYAYGDFNITGITDAVTSSRTESYTYTVNNRLQGTSGSWGSLTYTQDGVGNRTQDAFDDGSTTATKTLSYPSTSNLLSGVTQGATTLRTITHDGAGNIITDDRGGTVYNYRYNKRGRLDRLTIGTTVTADYAYDGQERMAIRTTQNMTPASTTHYVYDRAGRLIAESSGTGAALREYIWVDDMPLAVIADIDTATPNLWYVHADHLNRPQRMTDDTKAVVWNAWYWPYGEVRSITGSASLNLRFPGQYFLVESGLHYNWHRHYDPTTGRYIQADPLGFVDGPSIYAYVSSSPLVKVDPTGLAPKDKKFGLPDDFWKWYHRKYKKPGDPDLETPEEAEEAYEEWCKAGKPGPDNKGRREYRFDAPPFILPPRPRLPGGGSSGIFPPSPMPAF